MTTTEIAQHLMAQNKESARTELRSALEVLARDVTRLQHFLAMGDEVLAYGVSLGQRALHIDQTTARLRALSDQDAIVQLILQDR